MVASASEDVPWNGPVESKPSPCSEMCGSSYVFHDVMWKQPILTKASLLCLNLIARNQEKLQVARALPRRYMRIDSVLSIQTDGVYFQPPSRNYEAFVRAVKSVKSVSYTHSDAADE